MSAVGTSTYPVLVSAEVKARGRTDHFTSFMADGKPIMKNGQLCGEPNNRNTTDETNGYQEMKVTQMPAAKATPWMVILFHAASVSCTNRQFPECLIHRAHVLIS